MSTSAEAQEPTALVDGRTGPEQSGADVSGINPSTGAADAAFATTVLSSHRGDDGESPFVAAEPDAVPESSAAAAAALHAPQQQTTATPQKAPAPAPVAFSESPARPAAAAGSPRAPAPASAASAGVAVAEDLFPPPGAHQRPVDAEDDSRGDAAAAAAAGPDATRTALVPSGSDDAGARALIDPDAIRNADDDGGDDDDYFGAGDDDDDNDDTGAGTEPWRIAGADQYAQTLHLYLADDTTSAVAPRQVMQGPGTGAFSGVRPFLSSTSSSSAAARGGGYAPGAGAHTDPDPDAAAVKEFVSVLEAYLKDCEHKNLYLEAEIAKKRLQELKGHEAQRQLELLRQRHVTEQIELQGAHGTEMAAFDAVWSERIRDFEGRVEVAAYELQQRHEDGLRGELDGLSMRLDSRPRFSQTLLQMRRVETSLARAKDFLEAHRAKLKADAVEARERDSIRGDNEVRLALLEQKVVAQQRAEVAAMLQRVEAARARLLRRRQKDLDRFVQRFSNLQNCLAHRQRSETARLAAQLPAHLQSIVTAPPASLAANGFTPTGTGAAAAGAAAAAGGARRAPGTAVGGQRRRAASAVGGPRAGAGAGASGPALHNQFSHTQQQQQRQLPYYPQQQQQQAGGGDPYSLPALPGASRSGSVAANANSTGTGTRRSSGAYSSLGDGAAAAGPAPVPGQAIFSAPLRSGGAPLAAQAYSLQHPASSSSSAAAAGARGASRGAPLQQQQQNGTGAGAGGDVEYLYARPLTGTASGAGTAGDYGSSGSGGDYSAPDGRASPPAAGPYQQQHPAFSSGQYQYPEASGSGAGSPDAAVAAGAGAGAGADLYGLSWGPLPNTGANSASASAPTGDGPASSAAPAAAHGASAPNAGAAGAGAGSSYSARGAPPPPSGPSIGAGGVGGAGAGFSASFGAASASASATGGGGGGGGGYPGVGGPSPSRGGSLRSAYRDPAGHGGRSGPRFGLQAGPGFGKVPAGGTLAGGAGSGKVKPQATTLQRVPTASASAGKPAVAHLRPGW